MVPGSCYRVLNAALPLALARSTPAQATRTMPGSIAVCLDYHCDLTQTVRLSQLQWRGVRAQFPGVSNPGAERDAIRQAIALPARQIGRVTSSWQGLPKNRAGAGLPDQLDCVAESPDSTTHLQRLADDRLLQWHEVEEPTKCTLWLVVAGWSAVIRERTTGERYAVDSRFLGTGLAPFVQPLRHCLHGADFAITR